MIKSSILPEQLQKFEYYVRKLPIYLQQSEGFIEHFRIWYDLLVGEINTPNNSSGVMGTASALFNLSNIFNQKINFDGSITNLYLEDLIKFEDAGVDRNNKYGVRSDVLDKIGALFNVNRNFEIEYQVGGVPEKKYLQLNNQDFLVLIKAQIVKNYYDGSREQVEQYYKDVGLPVIIKTAGMMLANIYLIASNDTSQNLKDLFLSGLLTIESMGVTYSTGIVALQNLLIWSKGEVDPKNAWDGGQWVA